MYFLYSVYSYLCPGLPSPPRPPSNFQHLLFPVPGKIQGFKLPNAKLIFLENKENPVQVVIFVHSAPPYSPVHEMYESEGGGGGGGGGGELPANSGNFAFLSQVLLGQRKSISLCKI